MPDYGCGRLFIRDNGNRSGFVLVGDFDAFDHRPGPTQHIQYRPISGRARAFSGASDPGSAEVFLTSIEESAGPSLRAALNARGAIPFRAEFENRKSLAFEALLMGFDDTPLRLELSGGLDWS